MSGHDWKEVKNREETVEVVADEKSQEVDSKDEVMHVGKSDQWSLPARRYASAGLCDSDVSRRLSVVRPSVTRRYCT